MTKEDSEAVRKIVREELRRVLGELASAVRDIAPVGPPVGWFQTRLAAALRQIAGRL